MSVLQLHLTFNINLHYDIEVQAHCNIVQTLPVVISPSSIPGLLVCLLVYCPGAAGTPASPSKHIADLDHMQLYENATIPDQAQSIIV